MNNNNSYRMGLEELVVVISESGSPEAAKSILTANYQKLDPNEEKGRILSADHSLMAKGWMRLEQGKPVVISDLKRIVKLIYKYNYFLRISLGTIENELLLMFYFDGNHILQHKIENGVIHEITLIPDIDAAINKVIEFFNLESNGFPIPAGLEIPLADLEEARSHTEGNIEKISTILTKSNLPKKLISLMAEDLLNQKNRGTVIRLEPSGDQLKSDKGFLVLFGKKKNWLFPIFEKEGIPFLRILSGDKDTLAAQMRELYY